MVVLNTTINDDSLSLAIGCGLLAFSPTLTLLFIFTGPKAPLIILVTISAFAQLLACLLASVLHLPITLFGSLGDTALIIIPISIISQALCRYGFVVIYHRVEKVVEESIQHEVEKRRPHDSNRGNNSNTTNNDTPCNTKLRVHLNFVSSGIVAGVGFGGMKTVMLYGTLLASEVNRLGTLYQPSCSLPSLVNSALLAFLFSNLDIIWMMICFYAKTTDNDPWSFRRGALGGKAALTVMLLSHLAASLATTPNNFMKSNGCLVSLPLVLAVLMGTSIFFWFFCEDTSRRIRLDQNENFRLD